MAETINYKFPIPTLSGVADISLVGDAIEDIDSTIKSVSDVAGGKAPENHASISDTYGLANATNYGHVRLSDNTTSNATATAGVAATPAAVKAAYDKAVSIEDYAQHTSTVFVAAANARAESKSGQMQELSPNPERIMFAREQTTKKRYKQQSIVLSLQAESFN